MSGRLSSSQSRTLASLAGESDAELFAQGLLDLARRVQRSDNLEAAVFLYHWFESEECPSLPGVQAQARRELDAIEGRGATGARAEFLAGRLARDASDPAAIFAMGAAGALFRATRLATLARLGANPESGFLTRGLGARTISSLTGFSVEATAFPFMHRLGDSALGRSHPWEARQLGHELAASFFTLGALKLCGWGAGEAFRRTQGLARGALPSIGQRAFQQAGMFGGIMLGHGLETMAGIRERQDGATTLTDALGMWLQFNIAGNLTRRAFGENFHRWERRVDLQTQTLQQPQWRPPRSILGQPAFAMAAVSVSAPEGSSRPGSPISDHLVKMEGRGNGGSTESEIDSMLSTIERTIRTPGYLEGTREELLQKRADPELVDRVTLHQALRMLNSVRGIRATVVDDS
ncbi:MAG TPA: hypothetical protein VFW62_09350, partial [bacterium]|nr:hypothetical protein [bacterium]